MAMNQFHQDRMSTDVDWLGEKLKPLRDNKVVTFSLILAKGVGRRKNPIVTVVPGALAGFPPRTVVVSVINMGSCIIEIDCNPKQQIALLVQSGFPARLAKALLDKLHITLREEKHGTRTTPRSTRPHFSKRARNWTSTRTSTVTTVAPRS